MGQIGKHPPSQPLFTCVFTAPQKIYKPNHRAHEVVLGESKNEEGKQYTELFALICRDVFAYVCYLRPQTPRRREGLRSGGRREADDAPIWYLFNPCETHVGVST